MVIEMIMTQICKYSCFYICLNFFLTITILGKDLYQLTKKKKSQKIQFLYNPNNPKKSFDVYINKNPSDTIPIKYTTINDVKNTIYNLEKIYKSNK